MLPGLQRSILIIMARETLGSRLGFLALAAGCTIGLGNIWRFPFITGKYGGGAFVLIYLVFLAILGYPILTMELAIGRAGGCNLVGAYRKLGGKNGNIYCKLGVLFFTGNLLLLMYYSSVTGWLGSYLVGYLNGSLALCKSTDATAAYFNHVISNPIIAVSGMAAVTLFSTVICAIGLQKGVEKTVKWMMALLFLMLLVLAVRSCFLPGALKALKFYLLPDFTKVAQQGIWATLYAAMGQAFFTLSIGMGSMAIFGSYIDRKRALGNESAIIIGLDTFVALLSGLLIFPICFSFGVNVAQGPGLVFVSMPNIFNNMPFPQITGGAFFFFLLLAALTTLIAVIENIAAFFIDEFNFSRVKAALISGFSIMILSVPCALGFGLWKNIQPLGKGSSILDLEDFIVSQNILPLGTFLILFFCISKRAWGWKNFTEEADCGIGFKFPKKSFFYLKYILPLLIAAVFVAGYIQQFDLVTKINALLSK